MLSKFSYCLIGHLANLLLWVSHLPLLAASGTLFSVTLFLFDIQHGYYQKDM